MLELAQDIVESVDGDLARRVVARIRKPGLDAAVIVGDGFKRLEHVGASLEANLDATSGLALLGVEDVAGDAVGGFGGHGGLVGRVAVQVLVVRRFLILSFVFRTIKKFEKERRPLGFVVLSQSAGGEGRLAQTRVCWWG